MNELDSTHHIFRHIAKTSIHDGFIDSAAFRLRTERGTGVIIKRGLSVNWVEYFAAATPQEALGPLRRVLETKRNSRRVGGESRFALLNVGDVKRSAAKYCDVVVVSEEEEGDPSHAEIQGYDQYNDLVSEQFLKVVLAAYPPPPRGTSPI
jgi:hypothetical protein